MSGKTRLRFEEKKAPSKLLRCASDAPAELVSSRIHQKVRETEDDNVGVEAAHGMEESAEAGGRMLRRTRTPARKKGQRKEPIDGSNPQSKRQQKQNIKKQYAAAKRKAGTEGAQSATAAKNTAKGAEKAAQTVKDTAKKAVAVLRNNKKTVLIFGGLALLLMMLLSVLSSCTVFLSGLGSSISATTYPVADEDLLGAEAAYCAMEAELQEYLDTYEETHDYDSYSYDLDEIEHDPYVLLSAITALHGGAWTLDEVQDTLEMLFQKQYTLTETTSTSGEGEDATTSVYVELDNFNLSHVPVYIMGHDQLGMYASYMSVLGNRSDLFPDSEYVPRYITGTYTDHEIPPEALEDEVFATMIAEAEKYLGYPYVWGGSDPTTSFDCSGFVSWVVNQSGWNVGRLGAQGLCNICTPISDPRPGDLVFFTGTYDAGVPVSHVALYVGDGWIIHAGDPISYLDLNSSSLRSCIYCYGRLPEP